MDISDETAATLSREVASAVVAAISDVADAKLKSVLERLAALEGRLDELERRDEAPR